MTFEEAIQSQNADKLAEIAYDIYSGGSERITYTQLSQDEIQKWRDVAIAVIERYLKPA